MKCIHAIAIGKPCPLCDANIAQLASPDKREGSEAAVLRAELRADPEMLITRILNLRAENDRLKTFTPSHEPRNLCAASYPHEPHDRCDGNPIASAASTTAPNLREIAKRHARNAVAPIGSREHESMDAITAQNIVRQEEIIYWAMREAHRVCMPSAIGRNEIIEECAKVAMDLPLASKEERHDYRWTDTGKAMALDTASAIRALKT